MCRTEVAGRTGLGEEERKCIVRIERLEAKCVAADDGVRKTVMVVPAQAMPFRNPRRSMPSPSEFSLIVSAIECVVLSADGFGPRRLFTPVQTSAQPVLFPANAFFSNR